VIHLADINEYAKTYTKLDKNAINTEYPEFTKNSNDTTTKIINYFEIEEDHVTYNVFLFADFENEKYFITYTDISGEVTVAERNEELDVNSDALVQLTEYYITKGYKDRYRTLPCTKLVSATKNSRLYFACPQSEENLRFYINSKRVLLKSFSIDLGFRDSMGAKILYNVYYTETGYNSNSTMLEIRQG
jgi:hypothetical protein